MDEETTKIKPTKYCMGCQVRTFGTGWEEGLCDECWERWQGNKEDRHVNCG